MFWQIIQNKGIYVSVLLWLFIQIFKFLFDLIKTRKFNFKRLLGAGGMPSSHSAIVCAVTMFVGRDYGFDSSIFAMSFVFSLVVMYDAAGIRRAAGKQAKMLNKLIETPGLKMNEVQEKLVEVLGHTPVQVFVGAIIGIVVGLVF
ncbi:MAG: divergent PAP2 family protein [Clostridia bacterium]|nr:divergent PAP2 family protein [Clostridia bacterium]